MDNKKNVLLVGGAGYVGTVVAEILMLEGYMVRCIDNLIYGQTSAIEHLLPADNYEFMNVDLRDQESLEQAFDGISDVVIFAGLVGDPITKKYPDLSHEINERGMSDLIDFIAKKSLNKLLFISTCSNYGLIASDELASEEHELQPLSLYSKAKVAIEAKILAPNLSERCCPVILRFATAFGLSPRMRFDLTVNEFSRELAIGRELLVYDPDTWRPYCHVKDFGRLINLVLESDDSKVRGQVFNAGGNNNNATKRTLIDLIKKRVPKAEVVYKMHGTDPRNYKVNFTKVRSVLGFEPRYSIEQGIDEIISNVEAGKFPDGTNPNLYGNYFISGAK